MVRVQVIADEHGIDPTGTSRHGPIKYKHGETSDMHSRIFAHKAISVMLAEQQALCAAHYFDLPLKAVNTVTAATWMD